MALAARTIATGVTLLPTAQVINVPTGEAGLYRDAIRVTSPGTAGLIRLFSSSQLHNAADFGLEVVEFEAGV